MCVYYHKANEVKNHVLSYWGSCNHIKLHQSQNQKPLYKGLPKHLPFRTTKKGHHLEFQKMPIKGDGFKVSWTHFCQTSIYPSKHLLTLCTNSASLRFCFFNHFSPFFGKHIFVASMSMI